MSAEDGQKPAANTDQGGGSVVMDLWRARREDHQKDPSALVHDIRVAVGAARVVGRVVVGLIGRMRTPQ